MAKLPQRYTPDVNERIIENASRILAEAAAGPPRKRPSRNTVLVLGGAGLLASVLVFGGRTSPGEASGAVAFDRSSLISADATGTAARAGDFAPPRPLPTPAVVPEPAPEPSPRRVTVPRPSQATRPRRSETLAPRRFEEVVASTESITIDAVEEGGEAVLYDGAVEEAPVLQVPAAPRTLAAGTRLPVVLSHAVVTGPAPAPVTVSVEVDTGPIAADSILNGEAFAVEETDRVQIVVRSVVKDGRSVEIEGIVLAQDELGVPGKVIRKGSKAKTVAGRAVGAVGGAVSALSFGLLGGDTDVANLAVSELARQAGSDAVRWAQGFSVSTKAVRVEAGTRAIVFLRKDVVFP